MDSFSPPFCSALQRSFFAPDRPDGLRRHLRQPSGLERYHAAFLYIFHADCQRLYAVPAVWVILTVIGILRLRSWGRYSILIIGGGLAVLGVLAVLFSTLFSRAILPALQAQQPAVDPHIMSFAILFVAAIYLFIAAVGIWWLIYFNLRSIRQIFSNQAMLVPSSGIANGSLAELPPQLRSSPAGLPHPTSRSPYRLSVLCSSDSFDGLRSPAP